MKMLFVNIVDTRISTMCFVKNNLEFYKIYRFKKKVA